jgi:hypothetical protein
VQVATRLPLIIRGDIIEGSDIEYAARHSAFGFAAPDVAGHLERLTLAAPSHMADLYQLRFDEILDYLAELGERIEFARNPYLHEALQYACAASGVSQSVRKASYENLGRFLDRDAVRNTAERAIGIAYLEGWVDQLPGVFPGVGQRVRAFGARCVHVIAGNGAMVAVLTVMRNAITRSDAIIKVPSNDPLTAIAIVRTMIDMAPDHPLTKHVSVGYWKGGDERIERALYDPRKIEKIVAWGGYSGIQSVTKYLQPGLDLITLDPKLSGTIIGPEAFESAEALKDVAYRLALDIGANNQEACANARVAYVVSGTDDAGLARANELGRLTFEALQAFPEDFSTPHEAFDPELKAEIDGIRLSNEYRVFGGRSNEGAMIVSQGDCQVDFSRILACRVGNIVPIDDVETAIRSVNAYTQTIGIYPESLKVRLRDRLAYSGGQRLVPLGGAAGGGGGQHNLDRQDGIEPLRRMCKWITEETRPSDAFAVRRVRE